MGFIRTSPLDLRAAFLNSANAAHEYLVPAYILVEALKLVGVGSLGNTPRVTYEFHPIAVGGVLHRARRLAQCFGIGVFGEILAGSVTQPIGGDAPQMAQKLHTCPASLGQLQLILSHLILPERWEPNIAGFW
jgi:hypothetical protein